MATTRDDANQVVVELGGVRIEGFADGPAIVKVEPFTPPSGPAEVPAGAYRCAMCGGVYETDWSDDEAKAEAAAKGIDPERSGVVCDDCYQRTPWGRLMAPEMTEAEVDRYAADLMVLGACEAYRVKAGELDARYWRRQPTRRKRRDAIARACRMRDDRAGVMWALAREMAGHYIRWRQDLEAALGMLGPVSTADYMRWMAGTSERVPFVTITGAVSPAPGEAAISLDQEEDIGGKG